MRIKQWGHFGGGKKTIWKTTYWKTKKDIAGDNKEFERQKNSEKPACESSKCALVAGKETDNGKVLTKN